MADQIVAALDRGRTDHGQPPIALLGGFQVRQQVASEAIGTQGIAVHDGYGESQGEGFVPLRIGQIERRRGGRANVHLGQLISSDARRASLVGSRARQAPVAIRDVDHRIAHLPCRVDESRRARSPGSHRGRRRLAQHGQVLRRRRILGKSLAQREINRHQHVANARTDLIQVLDLPLAQLLGYQVHGQGIDGIEDDAEAPRDGLAVPQDRPHHRGRLRTVRRTEAMPKLVDQ